MRFTRLRLKNWKNFLKADVPLRERVYLLGPNAAGKSNLLDAFRFLSELASVGGGFQEAISRRNGVSGIRCLAANRYPDVEIEVALGDDEIPESWVYHLAFTQDNNRRPYVVSERVFHEGRRVLTRPDGADEKDPVRRSQTHLEQINDNSKFREVAAFFRSLRYLHLVPQLVREPDRSPLFKNGEDPYGSTFLEQLARAPKRTSKSRLERIRQALTVAVPQLAELELTRDLQNGTPHLRGKYKHWRQQGQWQQEDQFSDGTLRLIGLLWALMDGTGPLLLEEPELSLHEEIVKQIPSLFYRLQRKNARQILVSTHADAMVNSESVGVDEVLLVEPRPTGSIVEVASDNQIVREYFAVSGDLAKAVRPLTAPPEIKQLSLFQL